MRKEIPFSQARQRFSSIIDEVQNAGKAVTIVRHGKRAAVIISAEEYEAQFKSPKNTRRWKLAGSARIPKGLDIEKALRKGSAANAASWRSRMARWNKEEHG